VLGSAEAIKKDDAPKKTILEFFSGKVAMDSQQSELRTVFQESLGPRPAICYGKGLSDFLSAQTGLIFHQ